MRQVTASSKVQLNDSPGPKKVLFALLHPCVPIIIALSRLPVLTLLHSTVSPTLIVNVPIWSKPSLSNFTICVSVTLTTSSTSSSTSSVSTSVSVTSGSSSSSVITSSESIS